MNLPNKLTIVRMIAVPFFLIAMTVEFPHNYLVALIIFCLASITDYFDGKLARSRGLITNFGKFLDPLADKMLTTSALLGFMMIDNKIPGVLWITFITLLREFLVAGIRLSAVADGGKVVAANIWGKAKTVSQMAAIIFILAVEWIGPAFRLPSAFFRYLELGGTCLLWISAILTVVSGIIYVVENAEFINYKN